MTAKPTPSAHAAKPARTRPLSRNSNGNGMRVQYVTGLRAQLTKHVVQIDAGGGHAWTEVHPHARAWPAPTYQPASGARVVNMREGGSR